MEVDFRNNKLQKAYEKSARAAKLWGAEVARRYIQRIDSIYSMPTFEDVKALRSLRTHPLKGGRKSEWAITLTGQWRLIVVPSKDGTSLLVVEVTNHYGN